MNFELFHINYLEIKSYNTIPLLEGGEAAMGSAGRRTKLRQNPFRNE